MYAIWQDDLKHFTFHYVSIKTQTHLNLTQFRETLHSTMSLLKLLFSSRLKPARIALHSTMSLLKLSWLDWYRRKSFYFTFHYVSIKTGYKFSVIFADFTLHSTMSLLKPRAGSEFRIHGNTLHSTMSLLKPCRTGLSRFTTQPLHSTMSLLKLWRVAYRYLI